MSDRQGISPCRAAASPCAALIGREEVGCAAAPDLETVSFTIADNDLTAGDSTSATVIVTNTGLLPSGPFMIDYYEDRSSAPPPGATGELRYSAPALAAGDSFEQVISPITSECYGDWRSWIRVDTENDVAELDENDNVDGPRAVYWRMWQLAGWPVSTSGVVSGCPALALLDDDPTDMEVIAGDASGTLYAWRSDGTNVPGWPVSVGDSIVCAPAVGNIAGDFHLEVVAGSTDGTLRAFDGEGSQIWSFSLASPVYRTPALADIDGDGLLDVVFVENGSKVGSKVYVVDGATGNPLSGAWPVTVGAPRLTSPAVGDVDGDGRLEIAVCGYGLTSPVRSEIYLLRDDGTSFPGAWPVVIDTLIKAPPVIGDIVDIPGGPLEIVACGMNGAVYVMTTSGMVWPSPPRVPGNVETSPALAQCDKDACQEIVCASSYYSGPVPPFGEWTGLVTVVDGTGEVMSGWPSGAGSSMTYRAMVPAVSVEGAVLAGSPYGGGSLYAWASSSGAGLEGFPNPATGAVTAGPALADIDGDGSLEIVVATGGNLVGCYDAGCSGDFDSSLRLDWPTFRRGNTRTGCWFTPVSTDVEEPGEIVPGVTMIRSIHPNPFNPAARIVFDTQARGRARIVIYDTAGRTVALLADRVFDAGRHELEWNGTASGGAHAASGVYFCRLEAGGSVDVRKMILLR